MYPFPFDKQKHSLGMGQSILSKLIKRNKSQNNVKNTLRLFIYLLCFYVGLFHDVLIGVQPSALSWNCHWNKLVPPRVAVLCWVAKLQKILTVDNLKEKRSYP